MTTTATWRGAGTRSEVRSFRGAEELRRCFPALAQLHPGRLDEAAFLDVMLRLQDQPGYQVAGIEEDGKVVACVAFRVAESLSYGRHVSIEEIATLEAYRGRGFGRVLMDHVREAGLKNGCKSLHLNSGLARAATRRFYHLYGMDISSFHFRMQMGP